MNLLRLRPSIIIASLLASQALATALVAVPAPPQSASAFNFGKKKSADDAAEADKDAKDDKSAAGEKDADKEKAVKGKVEKDEAPPKEKHRNKEEIKEEEELLAEYEAYQKQLSALLKTVKTPFGSNQGSAEKAEESELSPLSIAPSGARGGGQSGHLSLGARLLPSKVYMPGHMIIGQAADFTIKGHPGYWAALAMADRDSGAKPIYGQTIRLGPDRKVVALGKIPPSGVLALKIFAPVAGDLVGGKLYFEAAIWPENNPERLELALPVSSETQTASTANSVAITGQGERKHGIKFVPDNRSPYSHVNGPGIGSGSPI
jgi:hypothetical protein